jgi:hypothetical protein
MHEMTMWQQKELIRRSTLEKLNECSYDPAPVLRLEFGDVLQY